MHVEKCAFPLLTLFARTLTQGARQGLSESSGVTCVHIAASDTLPISPVERWTVILTRARGWRQSRHDLQSARTLS